MTTPTSKKISRRDAIKLLGAATGAAMLANLPSKWKTPELASGVLPAHAQTSGLLYSLVCSPDTPFGISGALEPFTVTISPTPSNGTTVVMRWTLTPNAGETLSQTTGTKNITGPANSAQVIETQDFLITNGPNGAGSITINWSFENAADGNTTCNQTNTWGSN